jgi:hypothetical protein
LAGTIALSVLLSGTAVAILEIINPETDTTQIVAILSDIINTLIGVMAGFLAGRTEATTTTIVPGQPALPPPEERV